MSESDLDRLVDYLSKQNDPQSAEALEGVRFMELNYDHELTRIETLVALMGPDGDDGLLIGVIEDQGRAQELRERILQALDSMEALRLVRGDEHDNGHFNDVLEILHKNLEWVEGLHGPQPEKPCIETEVLINKVQRAIRGTIEIPDPEFPLALTNEDPLRFKTVWHRDDQEGAMERWASFMKTLGAHDFQIEKTYKEVLYPWAKHYANEVIKGIEVPTVEDLRVILGKKDMGQEEYEQLVKEATEKKERVLLNQGLNLLGCVATRQIRPLLDAVHNTNKATTRWFKMLTGYSRVQDWVPELYASYEAQLDVLRKEGEARRKLAAEGRKDASDLGTPYTWHGKRMTCQEIIDALLASDKATMKFEQKGAFPSWVLESPNIVDQWGHVGYDSIVLTKKGQWEYAARKLQALTGIDPLVTVAPRKTLKGQGVDPSHAGMWDVIWKHMNLKKSRGFSNATHEIRFTREPRLRLMDMTPDLDDLKAERVQAGYKVVAEFNLKIEPFETMPSRYRRRGGYGDWDPEDDKPKWFGAIVYEKNASPVPVPQPPMKPFSLEDWVEPDEVVEKLAARKPDLESLYMRFINRFQFRDAIAQIEERGEKLSKDVMEEVAWEEGYENTMEAFDSYFLDYLPLAKSLGADMRKAYLEGWNARNVKETG